MASEYQMARPAPTGMEIVRHVASGAYIPFDPANRDYQRFVQWCNDGNTPDPAPAAVTADDSGNAA